MEGDIKTGTAFVTKVTLNLACELSKLKRNDVRSALVDFEGIANHDKVNTMLYKPRKIAGKIQDLYDG